jgi:hypothetical protein
MFRAAVLIVGLFNVALFAILVWVVGRGHWQLPTGPSAIEYKDFIAILLTGIALMVALLALVAAGAAVWGFENIRKEAARVAKKEARRAAKDEANSVATRTVREFLDQTAPATDYGMAASEDVKDDGKAAS